MAKTIRLELFPDEHAAKVHAEMMKEKKYQSTIERVEVIIWNASKFTDGTREELDANEMWLVTSRK